MSQVIEYVDPVEGFLGWLVYDGTGCRLAAGGCRVQKGLTGETLAVLASRMTLKERLLGINVDGAKCGIDYDPAGAGKPAAVRRFLSFLRPHLHSRFSMGCDMGTRWGELEYLAKHEGVLSIKYAVKTAQCLTDDEFFTRLRALDQPIGTMTLAQRRAGHALAEAAIAAAGYAGLTGSITCSLQGFGNLGRSAAYSLAEAGIRITAIADEYGCVTAAGGLDVRAMLASPYGSPVPLIAGAVPRLPADSLLGRPADLIVLAGGENAMTADQAAAVSAPLVVVGANCGISRDVEELLVGSGILVIPDFVGGVGGSASMEALFGPPHPPSPQEVLTGVTEMMHEIVAHLTDTAHRRDVSLRVAAEQVADAAVIVPTGRPYGGSSYRTNRIRTSGGEATSEPNPAAGARGARL
jgi:glutamate dehydrogenase (NAD(P)+)